MAENKTFTLIGKFDDQISKKLKDINKIFTDIRKTTEGFGSDVGGVSKSINKMTSSLEDAGKAAGKVRDTVAQIGEGVKGLDGIGESLEAAARAAGRAQDEVSGIGDAAGRANRQADDLMTTLLKAEGLSKFGDAMAQGFSRGMNVVMGTMQKTAGMAAKLFKDAKEDELADIKAAQGIEGSFGLAGFKGDFKESQRMYKKYDQVVSEMIRQSSAPTSKVVELQRYTLDTIGPLMLAAQGVKKGTAMKDIDPKKIQDSAKQYGSFLEKAALFSQGTGSNTVRVAAGLEQLVTRGKIDTTIDFFSDNVMLMKNLEAAGFAGRGMRTSDMMNATDAKRMAAMMEAFNKSMSGESTKAMAMSLTGSLQGLQDTIFNPSVGILGMSVTFSKEEQKKANESIRRIQNERIAGYTQELNSVKTSEERKKQLRINIEQAEKTRDQLIKEDEISTPFKAFSYAFSNIVRKLTEAINAIGPVWTNFAVAAIEVTNKVFGPLGETLGNVASDMRAKKVTQAEGFGRIVGEVFKTIGEIMGDIANMINDPSSAMGKAQSEFMKGFMAAFKAPGTLKAAQEGIKNGLSALIGKFFEFLWKAITFEPFRPLMLLFVAGIFGPPLISAVIAGATPLILSAIGKMVVGSFKGGGGKGGSKGLGALLAGQISVSAAAGSKLPGVARISQAATAVKMKGVSTLAAGMIALSTRAPQLESAGKAVMNLGKRIPLLSVAFAGLDFAAQKAGGKSTAEAGLSAGGGLVGGLAGAAIGQVLIPIPGVGAVAGGVLGSFIGSWLGENLAKIGPALGVGIAKLRAWFTSFNLGKAIGAAAANLQNMGDLIAVWFRSLPGKINNWWYGVKSAVGNSVNNIAKVLSNPSTWAGMAAGAIEGFKQALADAKNWFKGVASGIEAGYRENRRPDPGSGRRAGYLTRGGKKGWMGTSGEWSAIGGYSGHLGDAISSEMRNKPSGSSLVIANSSETIIPAAGGNSGGMVDFVRTMYSGFTSVVAALTRVQQAQEKNLGQINQTLVVNQQQTNTRLAKLETKFSVPGMGSVGGVDSFTPMARGHGLTMTSGNRPGDRGWHGVNRARDYSNGSGPTPQMMAFARFLSSNYGRNLKELIYTPLGFSIKNGQRVPPYARAGHYNHVHVAYAMGAGTPAFFSSQRDAMAWENKATLGNVKVSSITSNSSEGMGGGVTVNAPITINQQPGQNSEQLASLVAMELASAIRQARSSSMYV